MRDVGKFLLAVVFWFPLLLIGTKLLTAFFPSADTAGWPGWVVIVSAALIAWGSVDAIVESPRKTETDESE